MRYAISSPRFWLAAVLAMAVPAAVMAQVTGATPITISGPLVAINGATLTVDVNGTQETAATTGQTAITVDGKVGTIANLKVGMNVKVSASGTTITKVVATTPIVNVAGTITGVNGANLTVQAAAGPVTFGTSAGTVVTVNARASTVADLKATMKVTAVTGLGVATKITATVPVVAVAGTITAIALPNVTVQTKTAPVTFALGAGTVIKIKAVAATSADLEVGMTVKAATELGVATTFNALIPLVHVAGLITAINGLNITVMQGTTPVTFDTDADTVVKLAGKVVTPADLKVGMKVAAVTGLGTADTIGATIPVVPVSGTITAIAGQNITVQTKTAPVTFAVGTGTIIKIKGVVAPAANLEVGMTLKASTQLGVATTVNALIPLVHVTGLITAINGLNITVMQGTTEVTFDTDADTIVKLTGKPATPADLKIKMHVAAVTALGTADTIVATIPKVAVSGQIVAIVGPDITILKGTVQTTFSTDANTVVKLTGKAATVADLKVGMAVTGTTELGIATALSATIPHVAVAGAITAINGANITVLKGVVQVTFATDANTKVTLNGKAATVADLKVGQTLTGTTALGVGLTVAAKG